MFLYLLYIHYIHYTMLQFVSHPHTTIVFLTCPELQRGGKAEDKAS